MLKEKSEVEVKVDGQQAGTQLKELREQARKLNKEYVELSKQKLGNSKEAKKIKKEFTQIEKKIIDVSKKTEDYNKILKNLSGSSIRDLTKLHAHLNSQIKDYGRNTPEYRKAVVELQKVKAEMSAVRKEMNAAIPKTNRFGLSLKKIGANLAGAFGITAGIGMLVGALNSFIQKAKVVNELNKKVKNTFDLEGQSARNLTADILAISTTFDKDYNEVMKSANTVSKEMGISGKKAMELIEQGFKKGSDNTGEFLDMLKEYPAQFKATGIEAETMFAIINQQVKEGIYSDKGVDAIKEAGLRLRENTKATADALKVLKESTQAQIKQEIAAGNSFAAIQLVSEALKDSSLTASETQTIIADVFGGPGEDAGLRYIQMLSNIDINLEKVKNQTSVFKDSTLELSKQYNKFTLSATEGNGAFATSLSWLTDKLTDTLTVFTLKENTGWIDKLKEGANIMAFMVGLGEDYRFNVDNTAKSLTRLSDANRKVRKTAEELAEARKGNNKLTDKEIAAIEKKKRAAEKAYKAAKRRQEKQVAAEKAALKKIYDFINEKELELKNIDPFEKKIAGINKFYEEMIASAIKNSVDEDEIAQLKQFRDEEISRLKIEQAKQTEQAIFDTKKKYGLLTQEELMTNEINAVIELGEKKILNEEEVQAAIEKIRKDYADKEKTAKEKAAEAEKTAKEKALAEEKKTKEKSKDVFESFVQQSSQIMADALADNNANSKDAMRAFLLTSLDMLKRYVQIQLAAIIAKEIGTKGFLGVATSAVLVGLVEVAFGAAKGVVAGFSEGGYTGTGQTQEVAGVVHKGEYVIPATMMGNAKVQHVVSSLETARTGGSLDYSGINEAISKGFADGGYTGDPGGSDILSLEAANRLSNAIETLSNEGVPAYVKDNTIHDLRKRFKVHEEIERNSSL